MRKTIILAAAVIGLFSGAYAKPAMEQVKTSSDHAITAPVPSEAGAKTAADVGTAKVKLGSPVKSPVCKNSGGGSCNAYGCSGCGTCTSYGCPKCSSGYSGGACNSYGCSDGGTCNSYGCSQCGTCSSYGCPKCNSGYSGGTCNSYGCSDGGTCNSYGCSDGGTCNSYGCSACGTCSAYGCPNCSSLKNSDKAAIQLTNDGAGHEPAPVVRH